MSDNLLAKFDSYIVALNVLAKADRTPPEKKEMDIYADLAKASAEEMLTIIKKTGYPGRQNKMDGTWQSGTYVFIPDDEVEQ